MKHQNMYLIDLLIIFLTIVFAIYINFQKDTIKRLGTNFKDLNEHITGPLIDLVLGDPNCPFGYEPIIESIWKGIDEGCYCKDQLPNIDTYSKRCSIENKENMCINVNKVESYSLNRWRGKLLCGKRLKHDEYFFIKNNEKCGKRMKDCGKYSDTSLCVVDNLNCPITRIEVSDSERRLNGYLENTIKLNHGKVLLFTRNLREKTIFYDLKVFVADSCKKSDKEVSNFLLQHHSFNQDCYNLDKYKFVDQAKIGDYYLDHNLLELLESIPGYLYSINLGAKVELFTRDYFLWKDNEHSKEKHPIIDCIQRIESKEIQIKTLFFILVFSLFVLIIHFFVPLLDTYLNCPLNIMIFIYNILFIYSIFNQWKDQNKFNSLLINLSKAEDILVNNNSKLLENMKTYNLILFILMIILDILIVIRYYYFNFFKEVKEEKNNNSNTNIEKEMLEFFEKNFEKMDKKLLDLPENKNIKENLLNRCMEKVKYHQKEFEKFKDQIKHLNFSAFIELISHNDLSVLEVCRFSLNSKYVKKYLQTEISPIFSYSISSTNSTSIRNKNMIGNKSNQFKFEQSNSFISILSTQISIEKCLTIKNISSFSLLSEPKNVVALEKSFNSNFQIISSHSKKPNRIFINSNFSIISNSAKMFKNLELSFNVISFSVLIESNEENIKETQLVIERISILINTPKETLNKRISDSLTKTSNNFSYESPQKTKSSLQKSCSETFEINMSAKINTEANNKLSNQSLFSTQPQSLFSTQPQSLFSTQSSFSQNNLNLFGAKPNNSNLFSSIFNEPPSISNKSDQDLKINQKTITVYVTRTGSKYHRESCSYLHSSSIPMSLSSAKNSYGPCSRCSPYY